MVKQGQNVIYDICDHPFNDNDKLDKCIMASRVVTSTETLRDEILSLTNRDPEHVVTIQDALDPVAVQPISIDRSQPIGLPKSADFSAPIRFLWYGNWGNADKPNFGMKCLLPIIDQLNAFEDRASLTVVSNSGWLWDSIWPKFTIRAQYIEWGYSTFSSIATLHTHCIIPLEIDEYTKCKSHNRVTTAQHLGLDVIASPVPNYLLFLNRFMEDGWTEGKLPFFKMDKAEIERRHAAIQLPVIAAKWAALISEVSHGN
ncbi:MAG TPA: hypothetical protein VLS45_08325 [Methylomicrobium sp.]|nr:hypothetical protein [Methylomicrobium sp.]